MNSSFLFGALLGMDSNAQDRAQQDVFHARVNAFLAQGHPLAAAQDLARRSFVTKHVWRGSMVVVALSILCALFYLQMSAGAGAIIVCAIVGVIQILLRIRYLARRR